MVDQSTKEYFIGRVVHCWIHKGDYRIVAIVSNIVKWRYLTDVVEVILKAGEKSVQIFQCYEVFL